MAEQLGLGVDVPRVAKRSTSRVVRRPPDGQVEAGGRFVGEVLEALNRAGVAPGDSFYVARVPPATRTSHLGDLNGPPGSRAADRVAILRVYAIGRALAAREACDLARVDGGWRRVSELMQGGHVRATGESIELVPGHPARLLIITDRGRAALEATREA